MGIRRDVLLQCSIQNSRSILLQCSIQNSRSILATVDPLDNGLFVLTLASPTNAPSEIIPTWNLRNDLHDTCAKNSSKLHRFSVFVCLGLPKSNAHGLRFAAVSIGVQLTRATISFNQAPWAFEKTKRNQGR